MEDIRAEHVTMVKKAANIHWSRIKGKTWIDFDDLMQAGYMGLIRGLRYVDPKKGSGKSYLWTTIYLRIQREISKTSHTLYVGESFKRCVYKIMASPGEGDAEYWANKLDVSLEHVRQVIAYVNTGSVFSLEYEYDEDGDGFTLHDVIGNPVDAEEAAWEKIDALCSTDFERQVVRLLAQGYVQREIGIMTGRPEQSVYRAFRHVRERYAGG